MQRQETAGSGENSSCLVRLCPQAGHTLPLSSLPTIRVCSALWLLRPWAATARIKQGPDWAFKCRNYLLQHVRAHP